MKSMDTYNDRVDWIIDLLHRDMYYHAKGEIDNLIKWMDAQSSARNYMPSYPSPIDVNEFFVRVDQHNRSRSKKKTIGCLIGLHQWELDKDHVRVCKRCGEPHKTDLHRWFWRDMES